MAEYVLTATKSNTRPGSFYDRIERFYDLTFKLNGYGRSLDQYFEAHPLPKSMLIFLNPSLRAFLIDETAALAS